MVKEDEFWNVQNECVIMLDSINVLSDYASKLLGFVSIKSEDENGNITQLQPCTMEHFANLYNTATQVSSYSDRFINKLNALSKILNKINSNKE